MSIINNVILVGLGKKNYTTSRDIRTELLEQEFMHIV